jgi:tetratricopeptide (TPR) repeat protein
LTDTVITALSRFSWFVVLPRNTSYAYKQRKVDITKLGRELGVSYAVEGSLRTAGSRVRVGAELLDAKSGKLLWTGQFDGQTDDPFEMEDRLSRAILAELTPRLLGAEARRAEFNTNGSAWDLIMRGRGLLWHVNEADVARAQELFRKAIDLEPDSGLGQSDLAWSYVYQRIYGWGDNVESITRRAWEAAEEAVAANDNDAFALTAASYARLLASRSDDAVALARRAIELNPNLAVAYTALSLGLFQQGRYREAVEPGETAMQLSPRDPLRSIMFAVRGMYYMMLGQKAELEANAKEMVRDYPGMPTGYRQLAVAYVENGQIEEAKGVVDEHILRLMPGHTATESGRQVPFGENNEARQHWIDCLRTAGLPE